ncbi:Lipoxygenase 2 [Nymphaea thermarum]|nr:Lipoxygenase 2 [Nymphaea thermarum]
MVTRRGKQLVVTKEPVLEEYSSSHEEQPPMEVQTQTIGRMVQIESEMLQIRQEMGEYNKKLDKLNEIEVLKEMIRFGESMYVDYDIELKNLKQTASVQDYQGQFENLASLVTWTPKSLTAEFIGGLKGEIQISMRTEKYTNLVECFAKARTIEEKKKKKLALEKITRYHEPSRPRPNLPRMPCHNWQDREEMIAKGLCFYCKEMWERGHKCKRLQLFEVIEDSSDEEEQPPTSAMEPAIHEPEDEPEPTNNIDSVCHLLADPDKTNAMRVLGRLSGRCVLVLLDSGPTHNFMSENVAKELDCKKEDQPPLKIVLLFPKTRAWGQARSKEGGSDTGPPSPPSRRMFERGEICRARAEGLELQVEQGTMAVKDAKPGLSAQAVGGEGGDAKALGRPSWSWGNLKSGRQPRQVPPPSALQVQGFHRRRIRLGIVLLSGRCTFGTFGHLLQHLVQHLVEVQFELKTELNISTVARFNPSSRPSLSPASSSSFLGGNPCPNPLALLGQAGRSHQHHLPSGSASRCDLIGDTVTTPALHQPQSIDGSRRCSPLKYPGIGLHPMVSVLGHQASLGLKMDEPWWPALDSAHSEECLVEVLTTIIWVVSGHHAVVNFGQYCMPDTSPADDRRDQHSDRGQLGDALRAVPQEIGIRTPRLLPVANAGNTGDGDIRPAVDAL